MNFNSKKTITSHTSRKSRVKACFRFVKIKALAFPHSSGTPHLCAVVFLSLIHQVAASNIGTICYLIH